MGPPRMDVSWGPALNADGSLLAFASDADNLVATDTNGSTDVFLRNLQTGVTTLVSLDVNGAQGTGDSWEPAINGSGQFVAFTSDCPLSPADTNACMDVYLRDTQGNTTTLVSVRQLRQRRRRAELVAFHQRGWALRRLPLRCRQPGVGRGQRLHQCVRA